jgi:UDP-N-acetylmuramoyl-L-alanyl-D-glutamate--2,6-diaminopimelate ligase
MKQEKITDVVMEVSSHGLDQRRTMGIPFDTAVFTNLTRDHLDYHQTMEAYFAAKKKLFNNRAGTCVINVDDPWGLKLKSEVMGKTVCYGINRREEIYPKEISYSLSGIKMTVETPIGEMAISSDLTGQHNVYNIFGAIGVGVASGLGSREIATGIERMKSVPGRFEKIDLGQDFLVIVDYAHTEDALARLLQSVSSLSLGHVITVIGCGGDRDRGKRPKMGEVASLYSRLSILTSDNPRSEPPLSIINEIEAGIIQNNPKAFYQVIPDREEAIIRAISLAASGDSVVIAGKGHERGQIIGEKIIPFDDRDVARQAIYKRLGTRSN